MSRVRIALLGIGAFVVALLVVLPARWMAWLLPPAAHCGVLQGSVWHGRCEQFRMASGSRPLRLQAVSWQLHPLALFMLQLRADVQVAQPALQAGGRVEMTPGAIRILDLRLSGSADRATLPVLPPGWSAQIDAHDLQMELHGRQLRTLGGNLQLRQLRDAQGTLYGDYLLEMPLQQAAPFKGQLRDLGGVLALAAQLRVQPDLAWQIDGTIQARSGAPAGLNSALDALGTPDVNGRRTFSIAGS